MGSYCGYDCTFRVSLHVSQDITVDKISDIDLFSFPLTIILGKKFYSGLPSDFRPECRLDTGI